ncbi:putative small nuclear ribonucleo protein G [Nadsonia fulvescens var. elongata DSM 6958]|uniref:Small nuclear ribonucleoprotein G n=1 Tax=Nadsonia fulvescens var. elongata DSM 6958 TaxID=857566 RepID=A0A1E3PMF9_9ASCO|nr:putative small nuclear ribonucleo protein G [Nadsonia fulvescens var. elongata DSM 6958]
MSKSSLPELKRYMDKKIFIQLNGGRKVVGILRGYDAFLNITLEEAVEDQGDTKIQLGTAVIRGNSVVLMEALERIS